jgi:hypothetical protein
MTPRNSVITNILEKYTAAVFKVFQKSVTLYQTRQHISEETDVHIHIFIRR